MIWSLRIFFLIVIVSFLSYFGAIFIVCYILVEKIFFPLYVSMKIHTLKNDGDILSTLEKKNEHIAVYLYGMRIADERDVLENAYFVNLDTLRKTYLKFLFSKVIMIFIFVIFGIYTIIGFSNVMNTSQLDYTACILGLVFLLVSLFINLNLLNKVWCKKFIIDTVDINGIDYHAAYILGRKEKLISLLKKIVK